MENNKQEQKLQNPQRNIFILSAYPIIQHTKHLLEERFPLNGIHCVHLHIH